MDKKKNEITIRSSAAEYLTYVAAVGDNPESVEVRYEDENIWLTQKMLATLYNVNVATINEHISNIYKDNELEKNSTIRNFLIVQKEGMEEKFYIDSAGTSTEEIGNPMHYGTESKLREMNIKYGEHIARRITKQDYEKFDYIIAMEEKNIADIKRIIGGDKENKIYKLLDFTNNPRDIADPWYTGNFDQTYNDIAQGLEEFEKKLKRST